MPNLFVEGQMVRMSRIPVEQTLQLRHSVLWPDMPLSQVCLPEDSSGLHFGALLPQSEEPIAVISLFVEPLPIDKNAISDMPAFREQMQQQETGVYSTGDSIETRRGLTVVRFRKFACILRYQGKGVGTHLLAYALSIARSELDATIAWCDARKASAEWYEKRGLQSFGKTFYKGSVEYIRMRIDLRNSSGSGSDDQALGSMMAEAEDLNF